MDTCLYNWHAINWFKTVLESGEEKQTKKKSLRKKD